MQHPRVVHGPGGAGQPDEGPEQPVDRHGRGPIGGIVRQGRATISSSGPVRRGPGGLEQPRHPTQLAHPVQLSFSRGSRSWTPRARRTSCSRPEGRLPTQRLDPGPGKGPEAARSDPATGVRWRRGSHSHDGLRWVRSWSARSPLVMGGSCRVGDQGSDRGSHGSGVGVAIGRIDGRGPLDDPEDRGGQLDVGVDLAGAAQLAAEPILGPQGVATPRPGDRRGGGGWGQRRGSRGGSWGIRGGRRPQQAGDRGRTTGTGSPRRRTDSARWSM